MLLIGRLKKRAQELDQQIKRSVSYDNYNFEAADDRELLEDAIKAFQAIDRAVAGAIMKMSKTERSRWKQLTH